MVRAVMVARFIDRLVTMNESIDHVARKQLATLARRLAAGSITNEQFEESLPGSRDAALHDIYFNALWPLYDDFEEHKLVGRWALTREQRTCVARIVLFLQSGLPYRYPRITGIAQLPVILLSLASLGRFGRYWRRHQWRDADISLWPFHSRGEYEAALQRPAFLNGDVRRSAPKI